MSQVNMNAVILGSSLIGGLADRLTDEVVVTMTKKIVPDGARKTTDADSVADDAKLIFIRA